MISLLIAVGACFTLVSSQTPGCDYYQQILPGQSFYAASPNYPNSYPSGITCRWIISCPNAQCRADCSDISLPSSPQCSVDRLLISKSGDPQLYGADTFCGQGTATATSTGNQLSIGLVTASNSPGGRFRCQLSSVPATPPTCSCGYRKTTRIVGGVETGVNEFPMMAALADASSYNIFCGGVIIDKRYVLTAAHCLTGVNVNNIAVIVGEHDVSVGDSPATQAYRVSGSLIHPQYNSNNNDYDAALLYVSNDIIFSDRVGPACLPFKFAANTFAGNRVTALGWGTLWFGGPTSETLQKVDLDVITDASCRQRGASVTARQFCTFTQGKDTCQLDSGGPLLYNDPATGLLFNVGMISFGTFCATNSPAVNTRVTELLTWIVNSTPQANYCRK